MSIRRASFTVLALLLAACAVNPATGRREISLVSEGQEIQMGREADPQISASLGLVDDPELQSYVSDLGLRLAAVSERPQLPWSFKVVDDPIVNAFALPGGFIYVTRGILANFETEAELVGVLGHEIGHVTARHSANQMSRQQLQQIGLVAGMVFSETVRQYGGLASQGLALMNLSFSRGDETQADELGVRYMTRLSYDAEAMVGVFRMLADVGGGGEGRIPEWQLTHPYPENRESNIREHIREAGVASGGRIGREAYLDRLDGLVYGEDPRQGFFRDRRFLHPDLAFELTFPSGWETVNQRSVVGGVAPSETALLTLQLVPEGASPGLELSDFLRGEGISGRGTDEEVVNGVEWARGDFDATAEDASLRGQVAFARYGGNVYRILGYANRADWSGHAAEVGAAIRSFQPLTDRTALDVQPLRIEIVSLPEAMSLRRYVERFPGPVGLEVLAGLNRVDPGEVLSAGTQIKRVGGEPLP